jgi:hypothetical protein
VTIPEFPKLSGGEEPQDIAASRVTVLESQWDKAEGGTPPLKKRSFVNFARAQSVR